MGAMFYNLSVTDEHYFGAVANRGKPVGNDKRGAAFHQCLNAFLYQLLRAGVYTAGGFVEN